MSNLPPGYIEESDEDPKASAMYQDLLGIRQQFDNWILRYQKDLPTVEAGEHMARIEKVFTELEEDIGGKL